VPLQDASLCLDEESIAAFVAAEFVAEDQARVEAHLVNCAACREVVADAACALFGASGELEAPVLESTSGARTASHLPTAALAPGDMVSAKYRIDARLGRGGMSEVFLAFHAHLGHRVALKVLRSPDPGTSARFLREAQICARLRNDHIVQVFDIGYLPSAVPYLVMEYLVGEDLARAIARGPLEPLRAVQYLLQAGAALRDAHAAGVVHRDLKPANLFLVERRDAPPLLKVLDFGISKYLGTAVTDGIETVPGTIIGSPLYMSPEQLNAPDAIDARADIWSLGVILYQAITGQAPFRAPTLAGIAAAIAREAPTPPSVSCPTLSLGLEAAILRCLEKDPNARFQTAEEFMAHLAPFAAHGSDAAKPPTVAASPSIDMTRQQASGELPSAKAAAPRGIIPSGAEPVAVRRPLQAPIVPGEWRVLDVTDDYLFGTWRDVFLVIWKQETSLAGAQLMKQEILAFGRSRPRGVAGVFVVEEETAFPASEARKTIADALREMAPYTACAAVVFEGAGFRASAVRSVVTGLSLAARPSFPYRVCGLQGAARLLAEELPRRTGQPFDATEFLSVVAELRASAQATRRL
jgi:eukaryotic-like serine/threonine-protein kinase